jgi:hypothetical protein
LRAPPRSSFVACCCCCCCRVPVAPDWTKCHPAGCFATTGLGLLLPRSPGTQRACATCGPSAQKATTTPRTPPLFRRPSRSVLAKRAAPCSLRPQAYTSHAHWSLAMARTCGSKVALRCWHGVTSRLGRTTLSAHLTTVKVRLGRTSSRWLALGSTAARTVAARTCFRTCTSAAVAPSTAKDGGGGRTQTVASRCDHVACGNSPGLYMDQSVNITFAGLVSKRCSHGANLKAVGRSRAQSTITSVLFDGLTVIDPVGPAIVMDAFGQWSAPIGGGKPAPARTTSARSLGGEVDKSRLWGNKPPLPPDFHSAHNVTFCNVVGYGIRELGFLMCRPNIPCTNITIENFTIASLAPGLKTSLPFQCANVDGQPTPNASSSPVCGLPNGTVWYAFRKCVPCFLGAAHSAPPQERASANKTTKHSQKLREPVV